MKCLFEKLQKKDLLVVPEYDKEEYDILLEFIFHEVFVTGTLDKTYLLVISENETELQLNLLNNI